MKRRANTMTVAVLAVAGLIYGPVASLAHDPEHNPGQAQHGGLYTEFETHYGVELVQGKDSLVFHMTEHLQPLDMTGSDFTVFIKDEANTKVVKAVAKDATLVVPLTDALRSGTKVVLTGKDADDTSIQARFVIE